MGRNRLAPTIKDGDWGSVRRAINRLSTVVLGSEATPTFAGVTLGNTGLHLLDTDASHDLIIKPGSDLSADRILTLTTGDAARTITLSGNPTLADWFDQSVKVAASPTFGGLTIFDPIPILILKDSTYAGDVSLGYIEWRDSNNTRLGFFGNASSGNDDLFWKNESSGGHIKIETTGVGEVQISANTVINANLSCGDSVTEPTVERALNLIDTAGVMRIWRWQADTDLSPVIELIWGTNSDETHADNYYWDFFVDASASYPGSFAIRDRSGGSTPVRLRIDSSGNVGINEQSPERKLHVTGDVILLERNVSDAGFIIRQTGTGGNPQEWIVGVNPDRSFLLGARQATSGAVTTYLSLDGSGNADFQAGNILTSGTLASGLNTTTVARPGDFIIQSWVNSGTPDYTGQLKINTSGEVNLKAIDGNVVMTPAAGFHVKLNAPNGNVYIWDDESNNTDLLWRTDSKGNIGAVADNRPSNIYASADIYAGSQFKSSAGTVGAPAWTFTTCPNTGIYLASADPDYIGFVTDGVLRATVGPSQFTLANSYDVVLSGTGKVKVVGTEITDNQILMDTDKTIVPMATGIRIVNTGAGEVCNLQLGTADTPSATVFQLPEGAGPTVLRAVPGAAFNFSFFEASADTENKTVYMYGYPDGIAKKYGSFQMVDIGGANHFQISTEDAIPISIPRILKVGDAIYFTQTDGAERIDSDADGSLDLYAGTNIDLHATSLVTTDTAIRGNTTLYRRYYHLSVGGFDPGASGATWTDPDGNTTGGWQLNNSAEILIAGTDVHSDWDGVSDLTVEISFALNAAGNPNDTVDLQLICYYNGVGDIATKTQTLEEAITTDGTQFKVYTAIFTINYDEVDNVVDAGDHITFKLNLETDTSEIDDIIVTEGAFFYNTTHVGIESGDV